MAEHGGEEWRRRSDVHWLYQALLERFPQRAMLERTLRLDLDIQLNGIASENLGLYEGVYQLIMWAEAHGRLADLRALVRPAIASNAEARAAAWVRQAQRLEEEADAPVFGECFGLRQLHVDLYGCYEEDYRGKWTSTPAKRRVVVNASAHLREWASKHPKTRGSERQNLLVITGDPGSGKSSLARIFAADQARAGRPVLFIPLHHYQGGPDLGAGLEPLLERLTEPELAGALDHRHGEPNLLLVLDGLDELAYADQVGAVLAREVVARVKVWLGQAAGQRRPVQVLLTGRIPVVQALDDALPRGACVVELLPMGQPWSDGPDFHDPRGLLKADLRHAWWKRYVAAVGDTTGEPLPPQLPERLVRDELGRITQVPLLCILAARWWCTSSEAERAGPVNRNQIFAAILRDVYAGVHNEQRQQPALQRLKLTERQYVEALEDIALAVWQQGGRVAKVDAVCQHLESQAQGEQSGWAKHRDVLKLALGDFLLAFFFRGSEPESESPGCLEFTHKQFSEYLVARRLARHPGSTRSLDSDPPAALRARGIGGVDPALGRLLRDPGDPLVLAR